MVTRHELISLKGFLLLVAVCFAAAAALLIIFSTTAATVTGRNPAVPIELIQGVNTGVLGPGQQRWFRFVPDAAGQTGPVEQSLTVFFTPGNGYRANQVSFQIFEERELPHFYFGDAGKMANFGAGQVVSRDNNPQTGELFWTGWLFGEQRYYIQLANSTDTPIDYWLVTDNTTALPPNEPEQPENRPAAPQADAAPPDGATPSTAAALQTGQNKGHLLPGAEMWYSFTIADSDNESFEETALTMIVTPDNGNRIWRVHFDVFTNRAVQNWWQGGEAELYNVGAGSVVYRDHDPQTGELFWTGWVVDGERYYVRVRNDADAAVDYWLFTGDVYNPRLE